VPVAADCPVPLCTAAQFSSGAFSDLAQGYTNTTGQPLDELLGEATRVCESECGRRLAPFTVTETTRADGIDPDEYPSGASLPMPIQGTIGWSEALALGGNDLVRHCWLSEFPCRYQDLWAYTDVSVTVIRSYAGTETLQAAQILDGPDNTGHLWFQIGTLVPVGSRVRPTYSGGYTVAVPADLVRACKYMTAWMIITELNPEDTSHDPDRLHTSALMILSNYDRA
jgi:hypothetical protein